MICRSCLRAASRSRILPTIPSTPQYRFLTTTSTLRNAPTTAVSTPATSTSSAQPFSAPITPGADPGIKAQAAEAAKKKPAPLVKSSIPAGTPLKGLNFEKNKQDPVALPDDEYPAWLWTILRTKEEGSEGVGVGDLFCMPSTYFLSLKTPLMQFFQITPPHSHIPPFILDFKSLTIPPSKIKETAPSRCETTPQRTSHEPRHERA